MAFFLGKRTTSRDPKKKISARLVFSRFFPPAIARATLHSAGAPPRRLADVSDHVLTTRGDARVARRALRRARGRPRRRPARALRIRSHGGRVRVSARPLLRRDGGRGGARPALAADAVAARGDVRLVRSRVHPPRASGVPASLRCVPLSESRGVSQPRRRVLHRGGGQGARGRDRGTSSIAWHIATPLSPRFPASLSPRARGAAIVRRGGRARDRRARTRGGASRAADRAARRSIADGGKGCSLSVGRDRSVRTGAERTPDHGSRSAPRLDSGLAC